MLYKACGLLFQPFGKEFLEGISPRDSVSAQRRKTKVSQEFELGPPPGTLNDFCSIWDLVGCGKLG